METTETGSKYLRNCLCFLADVMVIALVLVGIDYIWQYDRKISCNVIHLQYVYNWACDREDDDGSYDLKISFKPSCSGIHYNKIIDTCIAHNSGGYNDLQQCWTNEECSIEPIFTNYLIHFGQWPWNICLIPAMILFIIAFITLIEILYYCLHLYCRNPQHFSDVLSMTLYQRIPLNPNINTIMFMNGYFRQIQIESNMDDIIVPFDIIKLCLDFYSMNIKLFSKYIVPISNCNVQKPVQSRSERITFINCSIKYAKQKRYEFAVGFFVTLSLYIVIFIGKPYSYNWALRIILVIVGTYFMFSFLYQYTRTKLSYYGCDPWMNAIYFDVETKCILYIEYCLDYGIYPNNMHAPIVYTKNIGQICKFCQLHSVCHEMYARDDRRVCMLELGYCASDDMYVHQIEINYDSYQCILNRMKDIMQKIDVSWTRKINVE